MTLAIIIGILIAGALIGGTSIFAASRLIPRDGANHV